MNMARLEQTGTHKEVDQKFLSVIFDKDFSKTKLADKERSKVNLFEKGLASQLLTSDTVDDTVMKIVRTALACEFGPSLLTQKGAKNMVNTITSGILSDRELRRSALIIADRFASEKKSKLVNLRGKKRNIING